MKIKCLTHFLLAWMVLLPTVQAMELGYLHQIYTPSWESSVSLYRSLSCRRVFMKPLDHMASLGDRFIGQAEINNHHASLKTEDQVIMDWRRIGSVITDRPFGQTAVKSFKLFNHGVSDLRELALNSQQAKIVYNEAGRAIAESYKETEGLFKEREYMENFLYADNGYLGDIAIQTNQAGESNVRLGAHMRMIEVKLDPFFMRMINGLRPDISEKIHDIYKDIPPLAQFVIPPMLLDFALTRGKSEMKKLRSYQIIQDFLRYRSHPESELVFEIGRFYIPKNLSAEMRTRVQMQLDIFLLYNYFLKYPDAIFFAYSSEAGRVHFGRQYGFKMVDVIPTLEDSAKSEYILMSSGREIAGQILRRYESFINEAPN